MLFCSEQKTAYAMRISDWSSCGCSSDMRIGDEEALVAGEAVDHRGFLAVQRSAIRSIRRLKSRYVGDILTQRQLAVHREIGERLVAVVLRGERRSRFLELLEVGSGPPVAQRAGRVDRGALIVAAVADLVADPRPARARKRVV